MHPIIHVTYPNLYFIIIKLTSIFLASVLLLTMNFITTLPKFIVNNRTYALKTDINLFFTITDCRIASSRSLTCRINTDHIYFGPA